MNRIVVLTTNGCDACKIMQRIVSSAYLEARPENTSFGCYDFKEQEVEKLINDNHITDFPTTLFIKDEKVVFKVIGTWTKNEVIAMINNKLNNN